jgi:hypothetical protein
MLNERFRSLYSSILLTGKTFGIIGTGTMGLLSIKKLRTRQTGPEPTLSSGAFDANVILATLSSPPTGPSHGVHFC